jgi:hypothetical protein
MIRNLIILDAAGRNLLAVNFGECHSLGDNPSLISSFVSAIYSFSQATIGQGIREIKFDELQFIMTSKQDLIFLISADDDELTRNRVKLLRISELFFERHKEDLETFEKTGNAPDFSDFTRLLFKLRITLKNCGGHPECEGCPNHRVLPLDKIAEVFKEQND